MIDFSGQSVLVTGAGRGLGRLYALEVARRGASVLVNDLGCSTKGDGTDSKIADEVAAEIVDMGGSAVASYDSVSDPQSAGRIIEAAVESFGRLDAVISNAGIFGTTAFEDLQPDEWRRMLNVHLDGGFYLSQAAYRVMKRQGGGRLVFISSSAGMFGQPMAAHYAAAKTGLAGLTNVIAIEGEAHGIKANAVLPSGISRMATETVGDEKLLMQSGFMRSIRPELVVPIVVYLASSACSLTHHYYSAAAGRFARVFIGLSQGWLAPVDQEPTVEDIAERIEQIANVDDFIVPTSIVDEILELCERRGVSAMPDNMEPHVPETPEG
ncbi:Putative short-chain type dehydrogenase/reductase [Mycolicibacterium vanbaalenii]|uniref:Short-chain type dehydrogenase/reductase n=1 Tax=Mycolicibacterium vanbaalenii TaxID=110539 RepID=A0A5S9QZQ2_MYCVN|nr:SDR family NAD(P)-dependent oxidoreductase [Mycolicibacterium vanbaalenii]CAA0124484.1 Putative short-chain type dehydrogenase/reductase [Mycolicibacterium vanbaalenii]